MHTVCSYTRRRSEHTSYNPITNTHSVCSSYLSTHSASRPAVDKAVWTWDSHFEFSSLLSQRSILWVESPQASTSLIRLSCSALPLCTHIKIESLTGRNGYYRKLSSIHFPLNAFYKHTHTPLHLPVQSLPVAIRRFGLEPSTCHPCLLRLLTGACVDNVAFIWAFHHSLEELLVFSAALPIGSCQGLTAAHDYLKSFYLIRII